MPEAIFIGGPLADVVPPQVLDHDDDGNYPPIIVAVDGLGYRQQHVYVFDHVGQDAPQGGRPVYRLRDADQE